MSRCLSIQLPILFISKMVFPCCLKFANLYKNCAFKKRFLYCIASTYCGFRNRTSISLMYCYSFFSASYGSSFSSSLYLKFLIISFITTYFDRWICRVWMLSWWSISSCCNCLMFLSTTPRPELLAGLLSLLSLSTLCMIFLACAWIEKFLLKSTPSCFLTEKYYLRWIESFI